MSEATESKTIKEETSEPRKRKLLVATDNFLPRYDGIARFLKEVLPILAETYEVTVVCPNYGPIEFPGVTIVQIPLSRWRIGDYQAPKLSFRRVKALVREHDVVFTQGLGPIGIAGVRAAHKLKKKLVHYMHSVDWELVPKALSNSFLQQLMPDFVKWVVQRHYRKCDLVLVPSESMSELLLWNKIHTPRQIVHLGVDTKQFVPAKDKSAAKVNLGLPKDCLVIGYHGRLAPEKDLKTLIRGFMRVKDVTLLVVGAGTPEIEKSLQRKDVLMVGAKENVVPYLQAMDIYVLTSLTETTSLSVLEAMSCGLPVISTPVGFVRDYIEPGVNGILIPKQDAFSLAKEIEKLQKSEMLRDKLGAAARRTVESRFTWDKTRKRIKEIFDEL